MYVQCLAGVIRVARDRYDIAVIRRVERQQRAETHAQVSGPDNRNDTDRADPPCFSTKDRALSALEQREHSVQFWVLDCMAEVLSSIDARDTLQVRATGHLASSACPYDTYRRTATRRFRRSSSSIASRGYHWSAGLRNGCKLQCLKGLVVLESIRPVRIVPCSGGAVEDVLRRCY